MYNHAPFSTRTDESRRVIWECSPQIRQPSIRKQRRITVVRVRKVGGSDVHALPRHILDQVFLKFTRFNEIVSRQLDNDNFLYSAGHQLVIILKWLIIYIWKGQSFMDKMNTDFLFSKWTHLIHRFEFVEELESARPFYSVDRIGVKPEKIYIYLFFKFVNLSPLVPLRFFRVGFIFILFCEFTLVVSH